MRSIEYVRRFAPIFLFPVLLAMSSCWSPKKAKKIYSAQRTNAPFDAIIVPGIPYDGTSWDTVMMARVHWAKYLFEQGMTRNIIFSGSAVYTDYYEGKVMREYAIALGLPAEHMFAETRAEHSVENVYYSVLMGKKLGFEKFAVATDPYQSYMMQQSFKRKVDFVYYLPFHYDLMEQLDMYEPEISADTCRMENFVALPERESSFKRFRGTIGRNVDFDKMRQ